MTNVIIIIILLAMLAVTVANYSRLGDIRNTLEQQGDSLNCTLYKLTEIRNNANDAGKKAVEALGNIHETLKDIRENSGFVRERTIFLSDIRDELVGVAKDVNYIKSLYEQAAEEAERSRAEEGKEADVAYDNGDTPQPEPEPEVAAPSFDESQREVLPKVEEEIVEAPTKEE